VDPAVNADLVTFRDDASLFIWMKKRGDGRHEECRGYAMPAQKLENTRHADAAAVLAPR
jgi:hypothetical protein